MPTIAQLPSATSTSPGDVLPIEQSGITRAISVAELLSGTQPLQEVPSPSIVGRSSLGPGSPEALSVGIGLVVQNGSVAATGSEITTFPVEQSFQSTSAVIINAGGIPMQLPVPALRALFSAGNNVGISAAGTISASTDPSVSNQLQSLSQTVTSTSASLTALAAKVPAGGIASLNAQGQVVAPIAGDATQGTIEAGGTGVPRTLGARAIDVINVLDFGAVTGGPDCTSAFNAAFNQLPSSGGEIFVPGGDYWISTPLVFTGKPVMLRGAGRGQARLHFQHTGIGFDFVPNNLFNKIIVRDMSFYAESLSGQTQAAVRITYPSTTSFGYLTANADGLEFFSYPNAANGNSPFPQTFLRGLVLNGCWSSHVSNLSWFGPPAAAGATTAAMVELNQSYDTRIATCQAYYGNSMVLQTGYCEGIYIQTPVCVGTDYLFTQSNETTWQNYQPNTPQLLGIWITDGEVNTRLGTASLSNVTVAYFDNLDITRDSGPSTTQIFFPMVNVTRMHMANCTFLGGPGGADVALNFSSTYNSSDNVITSCHFEGLATAVKINGGNGTVNLLAYGLQFDNVPLSTALIDQSSASVGNTISFVSPAIGNFPAGQGSTKDFVFSSQDGHALCTINNVAGAANYIRHQAATTANTPILAFNGSDSLVSGVVQTQGGNLILDAGGASGNGRLAVFLNAAGSSSWITFQNAAGANASVISTNTRGLTINPNGPLSLQSSGGIFAPNLPTSKPAAGSSQLWNNNGVLSIA